MDLETLTIKQKERAFYKELNKKLLELKSKNPKDYWNIINKSPEGKHCHEKLALGLFASHFKNLSCAPSTAPTATTKNPEPNTPLPDECLNADFTIDEVIKRIKCLKNGKACGADFIRNEMLKSCPRGLIEIFTRLFNVVLQNGVIPEDWCLGIIMPLHKSGARDNPDNYRGITLLSCLGKLFSSLINGRLQAFLDKNDGMTEAQAGFRAGYSTLDHIFTLHMVTNMYLSRKKRLYCAFVDFKKAFDMVDRAILWKKLVEGGMAGRMLDTLKATYSKAKSCVRLQGKPSRPFSSSLGVMQGDIVSPLLFSIFINDNCTRAIVDCGFSVIAKFMLFYNK